MKMKPYRKHLIIIHGAGPKHYRSLEDGTGDWQKELVHHFSKTFKVIAPEFPSLTKPKYEEWRELMDKKLAAIHGEIIFVSHSLGGCFLMKYLSENKISQKITALLLVATPFSQFTGFEAPKNFSSLLKIPNRNLYHSLDDVEVPFAHAVKYQELLDAKLNTFDKQGHYFKRAEFSLIINDIEAIERDIDSPFPDQSVLSNPS